MRRLLPILLLPALVWAQADCPAIDFVSARGGSFFQRFGSTSGGSGLARGPDGSYERFTINTSQLSRILEQIPRYEQVLTNCAPFPVGAAPASSLTTGRPSGAASTTVAIIKDVGDGTAVAVWTSFSRTMIAVYRTGPDYLFRQRDTYNVPGPTALHTADFNRDGTPDLAVLLDNGGAPGSPSSIGILRGNGNGTFQSPLTFPAGTNYSSSFTMGDFNSDGFLDFAVAKTAASVSSIVIIAGNGDGTFRAPAQFPAGGQFPRSIAALDFNNDGRLDLVTANGQSDNLSIHLGSGNGTFQNAINVPAGASNPAHVAWGDLNKDGRTDLLAASDFSQTLTVLLATGATTFQAPVSYVVGYNAEAILVTDINRDGNLDVAIADGLPEAMGPNMESGEFFALFGDGSGGLYGAPLLNVGSGSPSALTSGDLNGDGRPDLIVGRTGGISVILGRAPGTPHTAAPITVPRPGGGSGNINEIAAADVNLDGKIDLLLAERSPSSLALLPGNGDGTFGAVIRFPGGNAPEGIAIADFNGDGRPDVAVANQPTNSTEGTSGISITLAAAGGGFQAPVTLPATVTAPRAVIATDLNGDSRMDLLVLNYGTFDSTTDLGGILVFLGNGNGTFQSPSTVRVGRNPSHFTAADFNGDRRLDLAVSSGGVGFSDVVGVLTGNGNGTFQPAVLMPSEFGPGALAAADFSGDGKVDLINAHCCGDVAMAYQLGNGDGTFQPEEFFSGGADPGALAVLDLNADGKPDLAAVSFGFVGSGGLALLVNRSAGPRALTAVSAASFAPGAVAPESIVAAFGAGLANGIAATESTDLPTTLSGTTVTLTDSAGETHTASLFSVSPGQVNFLVPPGIAKGLANLTVTPASGAAASGKVLISSVSPGVFVLNAGRLAAALVLRVKASGEQIVEQVYEVDAAGQVVPLAIDFGEATDRIFLQLFGTGIRNRSEQSAVSVTIGASSPPVQYAGAQGGFPGLDQVNVTPLRNLLQGRGDVDVVLTVDGKTANTTRLRFK